MLTSHPSSKNAVLERVSYLTGRDSKSNQGTASLTLIQVQNELKFTGTEDS